MRFQEEIEVRFFQKKREQVVVPLTSGLDPWLWMIEAKPVPIITGI
jgi:hypothetical protein